MHRLSFEAFSKVNLNIIHSSCILSLLYVSPSNFYLFYGINFQLVSHLRDTFCNIFPHSRFESWKVMDAVSPMLSSI
jgi:hypothetical protein